MAFPSSRICLNVTQETNPVFHTALPAIYIYICICVFIYVCVCIVLCCCTILCSLERILLLRGLSHAPATWLQRYSHFWTPWFTWGNPCKLFLAFGVHWGVHKSQSWLCGIPVQAGALIWRDSMDSSGGGCSSCGALRRPVAD